MDSTEARYAEIAREMLQTGNWITLFHNYGSPFLAKPPLSTWLSALSMHFFGLNEFAGRLPSLLLSLAILALIWQLAKKSNSLIAVLILASSFYFYLNAGTVMTDSSLIFCTTLAMTAFWFAMVEHSKPWAMLFFVALGLGLLAKGPAAFLLSTLPIFFWLFWQKKWSELWRNLPLFKGSLIVMAIAFPWYILAELRTPGFLNYFIIGEHFNRFFVPSWHGNQYGFSHEKPLGIIWIYCLLGLLPWSIIVIFWLLKQGKKLRTLLQKNEDGWLSYLLFWAFIPLIFFSFSRNIIYTYCFSSLPAFALLFAEIWKHSGIQIETLKKLIPLTTIVGLIFLSATVIFTVKGGKIAKSQKPIIAAWKKEKPEPGSKLVYVGSRLEYSAQFYSEGRVIVTRDPNKLIRLFSNNLNRYLVVNPSDVIQVPPKLIAQFAPVKRIKVSNRTTLLLVR